MGNRVAIVGVGQTFHKSKRPDVNQAEMTNEAVRAALSDAQLTVKDIESVVSSNMETFEGIYLPDHWMASEMAAVGKSGFKVSTGGTSGASAVIEGFHLVASGLIDMLLVVGFEKHDTSDTQAGMSACMTPVFGAGSFTGAVSGFADAAQIYMKKSGASEEHAAMVRLKADRGACRNPHAHLKLGLKSVEEVLKSGFLEWPIRLLDFCPQSCGACALVLASEDMVKKVSRKPVWIADTITVHQEPFRAGAFGDPTGNEPYSQDVASRKLYKRNGITNPRKDICMAEIYEPSTWEEMMHCEHYHFCDDNEGWKLIEKGMTAIEGEFPVNPSGGVLSTNAIGATPVIRVAEAALQIRGDAGEHQVTRDVHTAVATGLGGCNWTTMVLLRRNM